MAHRPRRLPYYPLNVFEDIFDDVVYRTETPEEFTRAIGRFSEWTPRPDLVPMQVEAVGRRLGLPSEVTLLIARYFRVTHVEWLASHIAWLLRCAESDHYRFLMRQHRRLLPQ